MPPKRRGRKRRAEADIQPGAEPENAGNVVDFEQLIKDSHAVPIPAQKQKSDACNKPSLDTACRDPTAVNTAVERILNQGSESAIVLTQEMPNVSSFAGFPGAGLDRTRCASDEVFAHVPLSLREKMWKGQYINMALLSKGTVELEEFCGGNSLCLSSEGTIEMRPRECRSKNPNIDKWTDAFIIYMSLYIIAHKEEASDMLKYMFNIREAASRHGGFAWRAYDEQFRLRQEVCHSSWAVINTDLWWRCTLTKDEGSGYSEGASATPKTGISRSFPCLDFNKGQCNWNNCRFGHICSNCSGPHPVLTCFKRRRESPNQVQTFRPSGAYNRPRLQRNKFQRFGNHKASQ